MFQQTQRLKIAIASTLELLPLESLTLLAEFAAFLRTKVESSPTLVKLPRALTTQTLSPRSPARIVSPRLVHRTQLAEFQMEVRPEKDHDSI